MTISLELMKLQLDDQIDALDPEMADERRYEHCKAAVDQLSKDKPYHYTEDVTGNDGRYYQLIGSGTNVLTLWDEQFSQIIAIEYPAPDVSVDETPLYLDPEDWDDDYWVETKKYLYLPVHAPATTETMRIRYTVGYVWAGGGTAIAVNENGHGFLVDDFIYLLAGVPTKTEANQRFRATHQVTKVDDVDNYEYSPLYANIRNVDFWAICNLAACFACRALAAKYAKASDSTVGADSTTHTTRTAEFASRAEEYCNLYKEQIGLGIEQKVHGAGVFVDWNTRPSHRSRSRWLLHNDQRQ